MTTAFDIPAETLSRVEKESRLTGKTVSELADFALRTAYPLDEEPTARRAPFKVVPIKGTFLPPDWTSGSIQELMDLVEGSEDH